MTANDFVRSEEQKLVGTMVSVTIEIPRWSFVKYSLDGSKHGHVEFISPLPCPFNYGFVDGLFGGDQMPLDAIVMGPRLPRGSVAYLPVRSVVHFVDNDEIDNKLVCSDLCLRSWERLLLRFGFPVYVRMKQFINWSKGKAGRTYSNGLSV